VLRRDRRVFRLRHHFVPLPGIGGDIEELAPHDPAIARYPLAVEMVSGAHRRLAHLVAEALGECRRLPRPRRIVEQRREAHTLELRRRPRAGELAQRGQQIDQLDDALARLPVALATR
jgi:hypothetical protein